MRSGLALGVLLLAALPAWAVEEPLRLMLEGRYREAQMLLDRGGYGRRYGLMQAALTEGNAVRACSLYQVIAIRYSGSDCDSVARVRLDQAVAMGLEVEPVAEWAEAPAEVSPLFTYIAPAPSAAPGAAPITPIESMDWAYDVDSAQQARPTPLLELQPEVGQAPPPAPAVLEPAAEAFVTEDEAEVPQQPIIVPKGESLVPQDLPVSTPGDWFVQVGAFGNAQNAYRLGRKLEQAGYPIKFVPRESSAGQMLQVRVGGYPDRADLDPVMEHLRDEFKLPTVAVKQ